MRGPRLGACRHAVVHQSGHRLAIFINDLMEKKLDCIPHFYAEAPVWKTGQPVCTDKKAKSADWVEVHHQRVVHVQRGYYREAILEGTFLLASNAEMETTRKDAPLQSIEVYCLWHGHRLETRGPKIKVEPGKAVVDEHYSGPVVRNLARAR